MRISDWSSDVCSSDLAAGLGTRRRPHRRGQGCAHPDFRQSRPLSRRPHPRVDWPPFPPPARGDGMTKRTTIPALDPATVEVRQGSSYPEHWRTDCGEREKRALGDALGLNTLGVKLVQTGRATI